MFINKKEVLNDVIDIKHVQKIYDKYKSMPNEGAFEELLEYFDAEGPWQSDVSVCRGIVAKYLDADNILERKRCQDLITSMSKSFEGYVGVIAPIFDRNDGGECSFFLKFTKEDKDVVLALLTEQDKNESYSDLEDSDSDTGRKHIWFRLPEELKNDPEITFAALKLGFGLCFSIIQQIRSKEVAKRVADLAKKKDIKLLFRIAYWQCRNVLIENVSLFDTRPHDSICQYLKSHPEFAFEVLTKLSLPERLDVIMSIKNGHLFSLAISVEAQIRKINGESRLYEYGIYDEIILDILAKSPNFFDTNLKKYVLEISRSFFKWVPNIRRSLFRTVSLFSKWSYDIQKNIIMEHPIMIKRLADAGINVPLHMHMIYLAIKRNPFCLYYLDKERLSIDDNVLTYGLCTTEIIKWQSEVVKHIKNKSSEYNNFKNEYSITDERIIFKVKQTVKSFISKLILKAKLNPLNPSDMKYLADVICDVDSTIHHFNGNFDVVHNYLMDYGIEELDPSLFEDCSESKLNNSNNQQNNVSVSSESNSILRLEDLEPEFFQNILINNESSSAKVSRSVSRSNSVEF